MKRDQAIILLLAMFIGGYVVGRATAKKSDAVAPAPAAPVAVATATPTPTPTPPMSGTTSVEPTPPPAPAPAAPAQPPPDPNQVWRVQLSPDDPRKGPDDAAVKVVVFASYGGSEVTEIASALAEAEKAYGKKIQIVWKQKVFNAQHPDVQVAAEGALAANAQGKFAAFWEKATKGAAVDRNGLRTIAQEIGLDVARFEKELDSGKWRGKALIDGLLANSIAANTNPNVMVNGVRLTPPKNWERLKELIDKRLEDAASRIKEGKKAAELHDLICKDGKFFPQTEGGKVSINHDGSPIFGKPGAKISVEVYEDFQCPFCAKLAPSVKEFAKRFPNDVNVVYKHMPLTSIHDKAQGAAEASMAAMAQGKFWEYHDVLYQNQQALDRADLERYAQQVGLDMAKFKSDLEKGVGKDVIQRDTDEGNRNGVSGTPSVFINGLKYAGPRGYPPEGLEAVARAYVGL
jgi:protein-disulfide isomerase